MVNTLGGKENNEGVTIGDITFVTVIAMMWFFLVQVSGSLVIVAMSGLAWVMVSIYMISRFTGFLSYLKVLRPTWTIGYLITIPVWFILYAILPEQKLPSAITEGATYTLSSLIDKNFLEWWVNSGLFAITESLLVGFLMALLMGVALKKSGGRTMGASNKSGQFASILVVAGFSALLHTGIALARANAGQFSLSVVLIHQLITFFILIIAGLFFGMPAVISGHMSKNDIVYASYGFWWISLLICIIMDLISIFKGGKKEAIKSIKGIGGFD